jgi:hypothetical protein
MQRSERLFLHCQEEYFGGRNTRRNRHVAHEPGPFVGDLLLSVIIRPLWSRLCAFMVIVIVAVDREDVHRHIFYLRVSS